MSLPHASSGTSADDAPAPAARVAPPPAPPGPRRRRIPAYALRFVVELAVVFVGVYAAFAVDSMQRQRETDARRLQLEAALVREIDGITRNTRSAALGTARLLALYDSAWAAGGTPLLQPMMEPVGFQTHMWEATMASGALDLFDVALMFRLSEFYNELNAGFEQLRQLRSLSESVILPQLDRGAEGFYDSSTGRLRPQFRWYVAGLQHLQEKAERITALGESLVADLAPERREAAAVP